MKRREPAPPFFILGAPRSGTTLLLKLLDTHSRIAVCPESNFITCLLRYDARETFRTSWHYRRFMQDISRWLAKFDDPAIELVRRRLADEPTYRGSTRRLLRQLAARYLQVRQKEIFGEKTPENTYHLRELRQLCPEGRFVVLLRHPLDTVCSLSRSLARVHDRRERYADELLLESAAFVKRALRAIQSHPVTASARTHVVRYEALVRDPAAQLELLCRFLGVAYEPAMLAFNGAGYHIDPDERATELHKGLERPINDRSVDQYKRHLSPGQCTMLCRFLAPELDELPYANERPAPRLSFARELSLARHRLSFRAKRHLWQERWIRSTVEAKALLRRTGWPI